jgi:hypothetical protein
LVDIGRMVLRLRQALHQVGVLLPSRHRALLSGYERVKHEFARYATAFLHYLQIALFANCIICKLHYLQIILLDMQFAACAR